jgi:integrase
VVCGDKKLICKRQGDIMASIFHQRYTVKDDSGKTIRKQSQYWYIDYKTAEGTRKRVRAFKDKTATAQLAAKVERESELAQAGIIDKYNEHRTRPLKEHLADFRQALKNKGNTPKYAEMTYQRAKTILLEKCGFLYLSDIRPSIVLSAVAGLKREISEKVPVEGQGRKKYQIVKRQLPLSIQSQNFYLKACKSFLSWMIDDQRLGENPLDCLRCKNAETDLRKKRRALSEEELKKLIETTYDAGPYNKLSGKERSMLYILAVNSGFRASELASLDWRSFSFDDKAPTVTVSAAYSKHRKEDIQPIRADIALLFKNWQKERKGLGSAKVFSIPKYIRWADMIKSDLKAAGIEYEDDAGKTVDFHALRHTFITNLVRTGASPKIAQGLARHSKISLTMDRIPIPTLVCMTREPLWMAYPTWSGVMIQKRSTKQ